MKNQLTKLHKQCLIDMPMLIDVMAETMNQMHAILGDYYEEYCSLLNNYFIPKSKSRVVRAVGLAARCSTTLLYVCTVTL